MRGARVVGWSAASAATAIGGSTLVPVLTACVVVIGIIVVALSYCAVRRIDPGRAGDLLVEIIRVIFGRSR